MVEVLAVPGDKTYTNEALLVFGSPAFDCVELKTNCKSTSVSEHTVRRAIALHDNHRCSSSVKLYNGKF